MLKQEISRKDLSCTCKRYNFSCGDSTIPNEIRHLAEELEKGTKRAKSGRAGDARKEKRKRKHKNY